MFEGEIDFRADSPWRNDRSAVERNAMTFFMGTGAHACSAAKLSRFFRELVTPRRAIDVYLRPV